MTRTEYHDWLFALCGYDPHPVIRKRQTFKTVGQPVVISWVDGLFATGYTRQPQSPDEYAILEGPKIFERISA